MTPRPTETTAAAQTIQASIQQQRGTKDKIWKIDTEIQNIANQHERNTINQREARNEIRGYTDEYLITNPQKLTQKTELQHKIDQMVAEGNRLLQELEELRSQRCQLLEHDATLTNHLASLADVLAHQNDLKALQAEAKRFEDAISAQNEIVSQAKDSITPSRDLSAQRADILASIAIGDADQADLDKLDGIANKERASHDASSRKAEPVINQANQTIAGLQRKLADLGEKVALKALDTKPIHAHFLLAEVKRVSALYVSQALATKEVFMQLVALDRMHGDMDNTRQSVISQPISLPLPGLEEFAEMATEDGNKLFVFAPPGHGSEALNRQIQSERERLIGEGCEIQK